MSALSGHVDNRRLIYGVLVVCMRSCYRSFGSVYTYLTLIRQVLSNPLVHFCLSRMFLLPQSLRFARHVRTNFLYSVCPYHGLILAELAWQATIVCQLMEQKMELDPKTSDILVEMIRTKNGMGSCVATFDVQSSPSTIEPVDTARSDATESRSDSTKDSTFGSAILVGDEQPRHNRG